MKTRSWIVALAVLLILCLGLSAYLFRPQAGAVFAQVSSQGKIVKTVDLRVDQSFTVSAPQGGENTVTVRDGKIAVTAATCPDHWCMDQGWQSGGRAIVCLPNLLVIEFLGDAELDAAVG